jgi:S-adenosylmethionine decarboxylase proenzyme
MKQAAIECGATIVSSTFHTFNPHGVSGVVVIAESHLAIHTWPEYGYAAVDVFTCGETVDPHVANDTLKESLKAKTVKIMELKRGELESDRVLPHKPIIAR